MNLSLSLRFDGYSIMHVLHSSKSDDAPRWCVKKEEKTMPSYSILRARVRRFLPRYKGNS